MSKSIRYVNLVLRFRSQNWKLLSRSGLVPLALTLSFYLGFVELFPRIGWVDAAIYSGFALDDRSYKSFAESNWLSSEIGYQWARMGLLGPLKLLSGALGPVDGRLVHNLLLVAGFVLAAQVIVTQFVGGAVRRQVLTTCIAINPWTCASVVFGGSDGPATCYAAMSIAFLTWRKRYHGTVSVLLAGFFLGIAFSAHPFVLFPYVFTWLGLALVSRTTPSVLRMSTHLVELLKFLFGFVTAVLILASIFLKFGGVGFYVKHWAIAFEIGGSNYLVPFPDWKYLNPVLLFAMGFFVLMIAIISGQKFQNLGVLHRNTGLAMVVLVVIPWSVLVVSTLSGFPFIATPSYVNQLVLPLTLAFVLSMSRTQLFGFRQVHRSVLLGFMIVAFVICFTSPTNSPLRLVGGVSTRDMYSSQSSFVTAINSTVATSRSTLVFLEDSLPDPSYYIYFQGHKFTTGKMHTFAYSLPNLRRILVRNIEDISLNEQFGTVILFDSRNDSARIRQHVLQANLVLSQDICGGVTPFSWCFFVVALKSVS